MQSIVAILQQKTNSLAFVECQQLFKKVGVLKKHCSINDENSQCSKKP
ncbi:hypothetical protein LLB_0027 [Legionella longbeachae D-4968]|nr:hypothetical protein LLB_0027 [Legionella longbeachae D-4968]